MSTIAKTPKFKFMGKFFKYGPSAVAVSLGTMITDDLEVEAGTPVGIEIFKSGDECIMVARWRQGREE